MDLSPELMPKVLLGKNLILLGICGLVTEQVHQVYHLQVIYFVMLVEDV